MTYTKWAEVEADPGYQTLPPEGKAAMRALFEQKFGRRNMPTPKPAPTPPRVRPIFETDPPPTVGPRRSQSSTLDSYPLLGLTPPASPAGGVTASDSWDEGGLTGAMRQQLTQQRLRRIPGGLAPAPSLLDDQVEAAQEGLASWLPVQLGQQGLAAAQAASAPPPLTRAIPADVLTPPKPQPYLTAAPPTLPQKAGGLLAGLAGAVTDNVATHALAGNLPAVEADVRDLGGVGRGLLAGGTTAAVSLADPSNFIMPQGGGRLAQAGLGAAQGLAQSVALNDLPNAPANMLTQAAMGALAGGHARPTPEAPRPLAAAEGIRRTDPAARPLPKLPAEFEAELEAPPAPAPAPAGGAPLKGPAGFDQSRSDFVAARKAPVTLDDEPPSVAKLTANLKSAKGEPGISIERDWDPRSEQPWAVPEMPHTVVARDEKGQPVGALRVYLNDQGVPDLVSMAVDPAHQRKGIAGQLVQAAREAGMDVLHPAEPQAMTEQGAAFIHRQAVQRALADGLSVPPHVLADYPDLAPPARPQPAEVKPGKFRALVAGEEGSFDPEAIARDLKLKQQIANAQEAEKALREAGETARADAMAHRVQRLQDARATLVSDRGPAGNPAGVTPGRYYNAGKYNFLTPESRTRFDAQVQATVARLQAAGKDPKARVPFDEIRRQAREILPAALDERVNKGLEKGQALPAAEYEAAKNTLEQVIKDQVDLERRVNAFPALGNPADLAQLRAELARLEKEGQGLLAIVTQSRSQKGRELAYLKMAAQGSWDTAYWTSRANRLTGGNLAPDLQRQMSEVLQRGEAADAAGDAAGVRQARIDLAKLMGRLERTGPIAVLTTLRKAGMLTGVGTMERNLAGNAAMQAMEEAARMPAAVIDLAMSLATGRRTVAVPGPVKIARSLREGATQGGRDAWQVLKHGATEDDLARFELPHEMNSGSRILDTANYVFRLQSAADKPFYHYALRRAVEDRAALGHTTPAAILADESQMADAAAEALFATFNNENAVASGIGRFLSGSPEPLKAFVDLLVPFKKVPLNVAARVLDYAVVGGVAKGGYALGRKAWNGTLRQALTAREQKAIAMGIGRGSVGTALIYMGFKLAQANAMTGTYDPATRPLDEVAGRTAGSIKLGGHWVPLSSVNPVGNLLTLGATLARDYEHITSQARKDAIALGKGEVAGTAQDLANFGLAAAPVAVKTVLDQPFTQGAKEIADLAQDPSRSAGKFAGSIAASLVPSALNDVAKMTDGTKREIAKDALHAIPQSVQNRIPGLRQQLPPHRDAFGHPVETPTGANAVNILAGGAAKEDTHPLIQSMLALKVNPPQVKDTIRLGRQDLKLTPALKDSLVQHIGAEAEQLGEKIVASPKFKALDPEDQKDILRRIFATARHAGQAQFLAANKEAVVDQFKRATAARQRARTGGAAASGPAAQTIDAQRQRLLERAANEPL